MLKRIAVIVVLICVLSGGIYAQEAMFKPVKEYSDTTFTDVSAKDWFSNDVAQVYKTGLMNGMSEYTFSPGSDVSVAQGITLASRLNAAYYGKAIDNIDGQWYDMYVEYAKNQGFLKDGDFDSYTKSISRIDLCNLCAKALPSEYFTPKNDVEAIPDVSNDRVGYKNILMLYNAGVVMGNDEYGTFNPDSNIKRSEFAAVINRIITPSARLQKQLFVKQNRAMMLIEDNELSFHGWNRDTRGMSYYERILKTKDDVLFELMTDSSEVFPVNISRDFKVTDSGKLILTTNFKLLKDTDGFSYVLDDGNGNKVLEFAVRDGSYYIQDIKIDTFDFDEYVTLKANIDLDKKSATIYCNSKLIDNVKLSNSICSRVIIGIDEKGKGSFQTGGLYLSSDYYINEKFLGNTNAADWKAGGANLEIAEEADNTYSLEDIKFAKLTSTSDNASVKYTFDNVTGNTAVEWRFLMPEHHDGVSFMLGDNTNGFCVTTKNNQLVNADGKVIGGFTQNVWTTVRAEINASKKTALVRINGKDKGEFALCGNAEFSQFAVCAKNANGIQVFFDDITVTPIAPTPKDYVPAPVPAEKDEYYLGLNTCNLWEFGYWHGVTSSWHVVSAYDELTPYLGYYDDGNPEVSDWEIKWMSEHGIDYQLQCWYGPQNGNAPVKSPGFSQNLHDGYFNAKYKDYCKFAVMWENNFTQKIDSYGFRNYFVPFWMDYYFKDPNYFVIDNKPVFSIYSYTRFVEYFGGVEECKAELDYLRDQVKGLGFDDLIIMFANGSADEQTYKDMAYMGAVGAYNYNLGKQSDKPEHQMGVMESNAKKGASSNGCAYVPTISVGFNNVARGDTRSDNITLEDYDKICAWTKDSLLSDSKYYDQNSIMSKMVLLSCWNEYDEGHYIIPSNLYGFGFLDVLREHFSNSKGVHTDIKPTCEQIERLCDLYPEDFSMLRPTRWYKYQSDGLGNIDEAQRVLVYDFTDESTYDSSWRLGNGSVISNNNGLKFKSLTEDQMLQKELEFDINPNQLVHVRFSAQSESLTKMGYFEVFFKTQEFNQHAQRMSRRASYNYGETVDLYIDFSANSYWRGTCTGLRFDFLNELGNVNLELIEVLQLENDETLYTLNIDGGACDIELPIQEKDGNVYVPFVPASGIFAMLNSSYKWDRVDGILQMKVAMSDVTLEIDKSKAVNGVNVPAPYLLDGIPMIPIKEFCKAVGYTCNINGNVITIDTGVYGQAARQINDYMNSKPAHSYMFEVDGNFEGWENTSKIENKTVKDGSLYGYSTSNDPNLTFATPNIDANVYKKCIIRMKTDIARDSHISIYFADSVTPLSEQRSVKSALSCANKDYVEYVIDMSENSFWKDGITKLRFDPFDCEGHFWIDSIEFTAE